MCLWGGGVVIAKKSENLLFSNIGKKEIMIICKNLGYISEYFLRIDPHSAREGNIFNALHTSHQGAL